MKMILRGICFAGIFRDSCTFCQFKEVCSFDRRLQGYEKEELKDLETEEVWKEIRSVVEAEKTGKNE